MSKSFSVGAKVTMRNGFVEGVVTSTMTDGNGESYRVAWWDGNQRRESWVHPAELNTESPVQVKEETVYADPDAVEILPPEEATDSAA